MKKTITTLKDILIPLCKDQQPERARSTLSPKALKTYLIVSELLDPITVPYIKNEFKLPTNLERVWKVNSSDCGKVLYLPPIKKHDYFVPILSLECSLNETLSSAKFRVVLICLKEHQATKVLQGVGFRMETPDSLNQRANPTVNQGIHDFYHAQLVRKLDRKLRHNVQITCPNWFPDVQPSFPLPADCPVTLLLCLIVTLYGRIYYNQFLEENKKHMTFIKPYEEKLDKWINWN